MLCQEKSVPQDKFSVFRIPCAFCFATTSVLNTQKSILIGPRCEKSCLRGFANNTGADQPGHPRSLISSFVIRFLESIICKLATGEISIS